MGWIRVQETALTHPKLVALIDVRRPFDLWMWGLAYAQTYLTDGRLPAEALPKGCGRAVQVLIDRGLWERVAGDFRVHDYLQWNESRALVEQKRAEARSRAKKSRSAPRDSAANVHRTSPSSVLLRTEHLSEGESEGKPTTSAIVSDEIAERAGRFVERYAVLYSEKRQGAKYLRRQPALDWDRACTLCRTWDDARLEKMAVIFLTTDDEWISQTDRGFAVFVARASWCDERLSAWEADQRRKARA